MKRVLIGIFASMLLVACGGEKTAQQEEGKGNAKEEQTKPAESDTESMDGEKPKAEEKATSHEKPEPEYRMNEGTFALEPISDADPQVLLVTIDDAPDQHALEMAKKLKDMDAPAIFFVNGHFIDSPEKEAVVKEIYDMGFEIGNHTYSHEDLTTLPEEKQKEEILSVNKAVEEITGEKPTFFRAPFGKNTDYSKKLIKDEGMTLMNWTYGYDWNKEYMTKEAIADIMIHTPLLQDGANLLMHDRDWTNAALEEIVHGLRDKGYEMLDPDLIQTDHEKEEADQE